MTRQGSRQTGAMHPKGVYRRCQQALSECLLTQGHLTMLYTSKGQSETASVYMYIATCKVL